MSIQIPQRVLDRVWARVDVRGPDDCWPWLLSVNGPGYGQIGWGDQGKNHMVGAHRAAWTAVHGPIPDDLTVDHMCANRVCCNPAHLRLLPRDVHSSVDWYRDPESHRTNAYKTHCPQGHPYDVDNTYIRPDGDRGCRVCRAEASRRYQARKAVA